MWPLVPPCHGAKQKGGGKYALRLDRPIHVRAHTHTHTDTHTHVHRPDRSIPVKRERPDVYISKLDQTQTDLSRAKGYGGGGIGVEEEMRGVG